MSSRRGTEMTITGFIIAFIVLSVVFFLALRLADRSEHNDYKDMATNYKAVLKELEDVNKRLTDHVSMVGNCNANIKTFDEKLLKHKEEIDVFRDQVSDTRNKQIQLRDDLSKKRPVTVVKPPTMMTIEVIHKNESGKPIAPPKSMKADPITVDLIKKQLDGLSVPPQKVKRPAK